MIAIMIRSLRTHQLLTLYLTPAEQQLLVEIRRRKTELLNEIQYFEAPIMRGGVGIEFFLIRFVVPDLSYLVCFLATRWQQV
ncbi:hypothetical protein OUZ56_002727 [Daphnia magna]|uniref:Uncharacterized protein n=1 Tax=Daphnia magna TaxID=35525 RepID=A0ABR0A6K0_9CRUS|nr:hypothetical protein OUZ56_002727 [Daphnia magna]